MNSNTDHAKTAKRGAPRRARGACLLLFRAFTGLIAGWWRSDRVRVSPREGELLRLRPGSIVRAKGMVAEVRSRTVIQAPHTTGVQYECQTELGPARLEVQFPVGRQRFEIDWLAAGGKEALLEHQVEVFG